MNIVKSPLSVAIAIAASSVSLTTVAENRPVMLDQVVVTATRSETDIASIAGSVQVIGQDEINEQTVPGQKLSDVLEKLVPGMGPSTQTVTDRTQSIRGRRVLVLIDGVSQSDNRQISRQMNSVRPENIERIEVISGASAVYGAGATGGMINIITKKPTHGDTQFTSEAGIKVSSSSLSAYTLHQSVSGRSDQFDYYLSGTFESRKGIYDASGNRVNPDPSQVSRNDTDTKDGLLKLGYQLDEERRLEASVQYFNDQMDSDYAPDMSGLLSSNKEASAPAIKGLELDNQPYTKRQSFNFTYIDKEVFGQQMQLQSFYRTREARFFPFPTLNFVNQSTSKADVYGFKLNMLKEWQDSLSLSYGLDYDIDKGEQRGQLHDLNAYKNSNGAIITPVGSSYEYGPDVKTTTLGLYLQGVYELSDQWTLNAGWRHERIEADIADYTPLGESWLTADPSQRTDLKGAVRKYDGNMFNAGVVYKINNNQNVFANLSQGFEVPDVSRLLRNAIAKTSTISPAYDSILTRTSISDANLDLIKTNSVELGWRGSFDNMDLSITAFYNESDKTIPFNADHNVDLLDQDKKIYGIETSVDYFINDHWVVGGSYTFTEGRSKYKEIDQWLDLQAADVSPQKTTAYVGYEEDALNARLQLTSFADYDKGNAYTKGHVVSYEIHGYTTLDLLLSYNLPMGTVKAGITNLLNKDYETVYSQWAKTTYGGVSSHKAEGRAYTLSYRVDY